MSNFERNKEGGWIIPANTVVPSNTVVPQNSKIGNGCNFGLGCIFQSGCNFGNDCSFEYGCEFENFIVLGQNCSICGVIVQKWLTVSNVDGSGRQVKIIRHAEGILIEAGCFVGTLDEFVAKAIAENKMQYVKIISLIASGL